MTDKKQEIATVGPVDPTKRTSPINAPADEPGAEVKGAICWFNGVQYSGGARVCSAGTMLYCNGSGSWDAIGRC